MNISTIIILLLYIYIMIAFLIYNLSNAILYLKYKKFKFKNRFSFNDYVKMNTQFPPYLTSILWLPFIIIKLSTTLKKLYN